MSEPLIQIRPEELDDVAPIAEVIAAAFGTPAEMRLVAALREASALTVSLVAIADAEIVGHIALSPVAVGGAAAGTRWLGLAPLAVRPEWQRRGIGTDLVHATLALAAAHQAAVVFVLGPPGYYGRLGFDPATPLGWRCAYDVPEPAFRVHRTGVGARLPPPGIVTYHAAFAAL